MAVRRSRLLAFQVGSTAWLTLEKLSQQVISFLLFFVLAPLLGPTAFGLFAIVSVFMGTAELLIVSAVSEALVTTPHLDARHLGTANAAGLIAGLIVGGLAYVFADPLASWFAAPDLAWMFRLLAP